MSNEKNKHYDDITEAVERLWPRGRALVADLVGRLSEGEGVNGEGKTQSRLLFGNGKFITVNIAAILFINASNAMINKLIQLDTSHISKSI